ncbi:type II toxin-antitoxin system VapC family toxin [Microbacterium sp. 1P10AE]|uniref:type II toxin-antitoxin system VapC family toxin n=1 Tax=Microbacterium sp. 1P10AE TaxID=3132286 RepID=UPI00399F3CA8
MIVLDAGVIIALFSPSDAHHARAKQLFASQTSPFLMHPLTAAETLVGAAKIGNDAALWSDLQAIGVELATIGPAEPILLARLRAEHGLKMPDTCVLATATHAGAPLATFDDRLGQVAERLGVRHPIADAE